MKQKKTPSIKAMIFDWGGVLIDQPSQKMMTYCSTFLQIELNSFLQVFHKYFQSFQIGTIEEQTLWALICNEFSVSLPQTHSLWRDALVYSYHLHNDMIQCIEQLRVLKYKTAILSNTEQPAVNFFLDQKYTFFNEYVFSCVEHVAKPDEKIFQITLTRLNILPDEAVFIDDVEENVLAARKIGIHGILFHDTVSFKQELSFLNVIL